MALASDLAAAFSLIQQQQALEERKEERHHDLALQLLVIDINQEEKALDRQAMLVDRQIVRAEKKYDTIYGELETSKEDFSEITGQLYKTPDKDRSENAVGVVNDIGGPVLDSLNQLLTDTQTETEGLMTQKVDINSQLRQARLLQDFYTGVGHDYSAGDPDIWDIEDFSDERLAEYMSQYPELEGIDQRAFYEGMKTRGTANLLQNMSVLNAAMAQAQTANLTTAIRQLDYDTKQENMPAAQIEQDILTIDKGVHSMLQSQANVLNNKFLAPAIQATIEFSNSQTPSDPEGNPELETVKEDQLMLIGSQISGFPVDSQNEDVRNENLRLGKSLVLGNLNYVNSIKGHLAGTGDLDYVGYANALQEIQFFGENARRQMEAGEITTDEYLVYKNQLERITGKNLNEFSSDMNLVMQAADQVENKGAVLAIAGMKDQYEEYVPSIDYDVPEDYVSPSLVLPDSSAVLPDSTMIFPDSSTALPDTSTILIDDPSLLTREQELSVLSTKIRQSPGKTQEQYAGFIKEGEPYYDPKTDQWYIEQPFIKFLGGFLPIPNPEMFTEETTSRQIVAIEPIIDDDGNIIGFEPPTFLSPAAVTGGGGERAIEEAIKKLESRKEAWEGEEGWKDPNAFPYIPNEENPWE